MQILISLLFVSLATYQRIEFGAANAGVTLGATIGLIYLVLKITTTISSIKYSKRM